MYEASTGIIVQRAGGTTTPKHEGRRDFLVKIKTKLNIDLFFFNFYYFYFIIIFLLQFLYKKCPIHWVPHFQLLYRLTSPQHHSLIFILLEKAT